MEELQARHRKEQRDLQSQITQKKKQATKKTRKAVNDECERLDTELKQRQHAELNPLNGDGSTANDLTEDEIAALTLTTDDNNDTNDTANPSPPTSLPHDPADPLSSEPPQPTSRKPNRQKARLARRAAEAASAAALAESEALALPDHKAAEHERMQASMRAHNLTEKLIRADGHCLYSAVADQLIFHQIPLSKATQAVPVEPFRLIRNVAADWIAAHREDFEPFVEDEFEGYIKKIRETGEWGGQLELWALARAYGVDINVLQDFGRIERIEGKGDGAGGKGDGERKEIWLGYYKHGFGLGEHYNSLRRKETKEGES